MPIQNRSDQFGFKLDRRTDFEIPEGITNMWESACSKAAKKKQSAKHSPISHDHTSSPYATTKKSIMSGSLSIFNAKRKSKAPIQTEVTKIIEEEIQVRYLPLNTFRFTTCMADMKFTLSQQN